MQHLYAEHMVDYRIKLVLCCSSNVLVIMQRKQCFYTVLI
jgi:hypothetical protein